jgi:hypothetical protein
LFHLASKALSFAPSAIRGSEVSDWVIATLALSTPSPCVLTARGNVYASAVNTCVPTAVWKAIYVRVTTAVGKQVLSQPRKCFKHLHAAVMA